MNDTDLIGEAPEPAGPRSRPKGLLALLIVALVTVPTVLSLAPLPWIVWLAVVKGWAWRLAAAVGAVLAAGTMLRLGISGGYFQLRPFEVSGRIYEKLGVKLFRRFVISGDYFNRAARDYDPRYRGLRTLAEIRHAAWMGRLNERHHLAMLFFLMPPTGCALMTSQYLLAAALLLANLLCNAYPVLLQRYTRTRFGALERRMLRSHHSPKTAARSPAAYSAADSACSTQ
jgi:hypothetical protein